MGRKNRQVQPAHIPFYKDERIIGRRLTVSIYLRYLIVALSLFAVTVGVIFYILIDYLNNAHSNRLQYQHDTDTKISKLACFTVQGLPDSAGPNVKGIRKTYNCPPFGSTGGGG